MAKTFIYSLVDCPPPQATSLPDLSQVNDMDVSGVESYAQSVGFILPVVGGSGRDAAPPDYPNRTLLSQDGRPSLPASVYTYMIKDAGLEWAQQNISNSLKDFRYTFSTPDQSRSSLGPHCDRSRWYTMMYLLSTGGDDHYTAFYREKGQDLLEREFGYHVDDYSQVDEIFRVSIPVNQWILMNTKILHSAENITGTRISYHISFIQFPHELALIDPVYL